MSLPSPCRQSDRALSSVEGCPSNCGVLGVLALLLLMSIAALTEGSPSHSAALARERLYRWRRG
jgi:hypothetical protein